MQENKLLPSTSLSFPSLLSIHCFYWLRYSILYSHIDMVELMVALLQCWLIACHLLWCKLLFQQNGM